MELTRLKKDKGKQKLCFIFGTRPEIIKLAPLMKAALRANVPFVAIHTGQHYTPEMDAVFFAELQLPSPDFNLGVGSGSHAAQTGAMLHRIEPILEQTMPDWVIVQGDTNSVLAGALAAAKLCIPVAHVEAGLRSFDRSMPEEVNRVLAGAVAAAHFVPTEAARANLLREGVAEQTIHIVGNTVVDAVLENRILAAHRSRCLAQQALTPRSYHLITVHRPENTDSEPALRAILTALDSLTRRSPIRLIWPMHPRTRKQIQLFGLAEVAKQNRDLRIIEPVGYFDMLQLQENCLVTITDSGGIQEESCILQVPCVTLRKNTERPESVAVGANELVSVKQASHVLAAVERAMRSERNWPNPFGDGTSAQQILAILKG